MTRLIMIALLLGLSPLSAVAQQSPEVRIEAARRSAENAGIPVTLLESRVAEGRAKGVPLERIAAAVEARASSLVRAREYLRESRGLTTADLAAGADAVEAGIGAQPLRQVASQARAEDRSVAIAVLTYLHRERGLPVAQALAEVSAAITRGPDALRNLPNQSRGNGRGGGGGGRPDGVGNGRPPGSGPPATIPPASGGENGNRGGNANPPGAGNGSGRGS